MVVSCDVGEALFPGLSDGSGDGVEDASPDGEIVTVLVAARLRKS